MRQGNTQNRQRSRNRGNNNRMGANRNNPNRAMESNGPDIRIRGNAAHIADKYMQLARDAQSSGDTIAAENFLQHAEHYNRVIAQHQQYQKNKQNNNNNNNDNGENQKNNPPEKESKETKENNKNNKSSLPDFISGDNGN